MTVGEQDDIVDNKTAKMIFELLPGHKKSFITNSELDHGPFSDN